MMKIHDYKLNFILLVVFCSGICAQQKTSGEKTDTIHIARDFGNAVENNSLKNIFVPKGFSISSFAELPVDKTSIMLKTRLQLGEMMNENPIKSNFRSGILNPLHEAYSQSQSMKELKYILGMVQAGAVGYMAYQHLKKYGFLKGK